MRDHVAEWAAYAVAAVAAVVSVAVGLHQVESCLIARVSNQGGMCASQRAMLESTIKSKTSFNKAGVLNILQQPIAAGRPTTHGFG